MYPSPVLVTVTELMAPLEIVNEAANPEPAPPLDPNVPGAVQLDPPADMVTDSIVPPALCPIELNVWLPFSCRKLTTNVPESGARGRP
jgi:hypothetical protein